MSIPVFRSYIRRKDMDTVLNCLVTDSVGPGEYLDRFQKYARESLGYDFGFALRSPITALETAFEALGLAPGDVVALPALAPGYYAHALRNRGLQASYVDALPDSCVLDLESLKTGEPRPKALVLFEALGIMPTDAMALGEIGIPIIEDISQSLGAYSGESRAGSLGQISILGLE
ncbi:MAG: DegT/DnrJ/EryC1/StrS aminotransferase family protein, partial [Spirochaetales bacterium]